VAVAAHDKIAISRPSQVTHWSAAYVGVPWVARGRDRDGLDCYGLVRLVFAEQRGVELPEYEGYVSARERAEIAAMIEGAAGSVDWRKIDRAEAFDVAVFRTGRLASHVGVMIDARRMLHVADGREAEISRIDIGQWSTRLIGIFRRT